MQLRNYEELDTMCESANCTLLRATQGAEKLLYTAFACIIYTHMYIGLSNTNYGFTRERRAIYK